MLIFSTIGIFVKFIPLPSDIIAMSRGFIGSAFLAVLLLVRGKWLDFSSLKKRGFLVFLSGGFLAFNWIFLFEAYKYTSIATATLAYYMAPVFVILFSPLFLKEALTVKKTVCVLLSVLGMVFVSGVLSGGIPGKKEFVGILLGLTAAAFYSAIIITNKKITHIPSNTRTVLQLFSSAVILIPYSVFTDSFSKLTFSTNTVLLLVTVGIIHTGVAYALYFGCMKNLKGSTVAIFGYIDPVGAIILSAIIFPDESITLSGIIGAILILGSAFLSEFDFKGKIFKKS
jgi:RarD protein